MSKVKLKDLCFEIIQKCPNNCKFCSSNANYSRTNIIKFDDFKRTVEYLYNRFGSLANVCEADVEDLKQVKDAKDIKKKIREIEKDLAKLGYRQEEISNNVIL